MKYWTKVEDGLPTDEKTKLIYRKRRDRKGGMIHFAYYSQRARAWFYRGDMTANITHWRDMIDAPKD